MYNKNYLAKRPFVVINLHYKPAPGAQTQKKGWGDREGWSVYEDMSVVDRITNKHQTYASVIIDVMEAKLIRNTTGRHEDDVMTGYMNKYKKQITEAITIWMEKMAKEKAMAELQNFSEETMKAD